MTEMFERTVCFHPDGGAFSPVVVPNCSVQFCTVCEVEAGGRFRVGLAHVSLRDNTILNHSRGLIFRVSCSSPVHRLEGGLVLRGLISATIRIALDTTLRPRTMFRVKTNDNLTRVVRVAIMPRTEIHSPLKYQVMNGPPAEVRTKLAIQALFGVYPPVQQHFYWAIQNAIVRRAMKGTMCIMHVTFRKSCSEHRQSVIFYFYTIREVNSSEWCRPSLK